MIKSYSPSGSDLGRRIVPIRGLLSKGAFFKKICCFLLIFLPLAASAQKVVTGTVKDDKGVPAAGATILEKGTQNATTADVNGKFSIGLKGGSNTLVISFIGYKSQEVAVGSQTKLAVTLQQDQGQLNEVVVIGYGSVKKSDLTGSVSTIKGSDLNLGGVTANVGQAIQGKAAGVQVQETSFAPGAGISITIRGGNSINNTNAPLFVVDGFISDNGGNINPNDIEDIEVLKDASATAIYGSRGGNGVVLITTKKGKIGKVSIDGDISNGYQFDTYHPALLNGQQYTDIQNAIYTENGQTPPYPAANFTPVNSNWIKAATRNATVDNRSVSVSSGDQTSRLYTSVNYLDQVGILKNTDLKRYTARIGAEKTLNDDIKVGANFYGASTNSDIVSYNADITAPIYGLLTAPTNTPVYNADGSYNFFVAPGGSTKSNSLASLMLPTNTSENKLFNGNLYLDYTLIKGLSYHVSVGGEYSNSINGQYTPMTLVAGAANHGIAAEQDAATTRWLVENYFTYKFNIHNNAFTILLGNSNQKDISETLGAGAMGYSSDVFLYYNLGAGSVYTAPSSYKGILTHTSYYTRLNYSYNDKLLATFTLRDDGSSIFINHHYGLFPSGALAYKLVDEDFIKNLNTFSDLKIRVGYGVTGNDRITNYSGLATFSPWNTVLSPDGSLQPGVEPQIAANPNIKWESTAQFDAGLDMGFAGGKINATIDYYNKKTTNLLLSVPILQSTGFASTVANSGSLQNRGIELGINTTNIKKKDFSWSSNFNISYNKQKLLSLAPGITQLNANTANPSGTLSGQQFTRTLIGQELGDFYGYVYEGVLKSGQKYAPEPQAKPGDPIFADVNGNGVLDPGDRKDLGNSTPRYIGGFGNSFNYKGIGLNVFFQGAFKYNLYNMNQMVLESSTGAALLNRFVAGTNENTSVPREGYIGTPSPWYGNYYVNSRFVQDASYVRLKSATLSYTFPSAIFTNVKFIQGLNIYAEGQNLLTFTSYKGTDPEVNGHAGSNYGGGIDFNGFPAFRTFIVGVKLSVH